MLSSRGVVLAVGAGGAAIAGLAYGVEEFVMLAVSAAVLLGVGAVVVRRRQRVGRSSLHLVMQVPVAEVTTGQSALIEMGVANVGRRRLPSLLVEEPRRHWAASHPGLGVRTPTDAMGRAGATDATGGRSRRDARGQATMSLFDSRPRRSRRERVRERRMVARSFRLPDLSSGADAALWIPVPTTTRGLLTLSDVGLWCEDPFRLFARRITTAPPAHVVVYPVPAEPGRSTPATARRHAGHQRKPGTAPSGHTLAGDELSGLRPYAPGDRLSRLHWPSLARSGELVVREFVEPEAGSLALLVDVRPSAHSGSSIEETISRAAGLGIGALQRGITVELCTSAGDRVVVAPNAGGRQTLMRALAMLGPADPAPAVVRRWGGRPTGGAVWATRNLSGAEVVLVTTDAGASRPALPESLNRQADTVLVR